MTRTPATPEQRARARRLVLIDIAFAVGFAVLDTELTLIGASWWPRHPSTLAWIMLGVQALACLSLAVQRRAPLAVVATLGGFTLAISLLISPAGLIVPAHEDNVWAPFATILAAYAPILGANSPWRAFTAVFPRRVADYRWTAYLSVLALTFVVARPWDPSVAVITIGVSRTALGPLLALYLDARRRLVRAVSDRARADERARLAGEMHDLVTRHVTLMVMQAGALRVASNEPAVTAAAEELRATGCRALDELRDLVGVLRAGPEPPAPGELTELVAETNAAGTPVTLTERGDPALASPVVARTVRHVVSEALTNVRKHAPGAATTVTVSYEPASVTVVVRNAACPRRPDAALVATGSGIGLTGLRRRLELVDGTLSAHALPGGGFLVTATLPAYVPTRELAPA